MNSLDIGLYILSQNRLEFWLEQYMACQWLAGLIRELSCIYKDRKANPIENAVDSVDEIYLNKLYAYLDRLNTDLDLNLDIGAWYLAFDRDIKL